MNIFHRHNFDPEKWKLISKVQMQRRPRPFDALTGVPQSTEPFPVGAQLVYSNTCTQCGDIVFRRVSEIG
jgi:hypothetical protein